MATTKRATGAAKAPARKSAPKKPATRNQVAAAAKAALAAAEAAKAPVAETAPAVPTRGPVSLVVTAKGTRVFQDARGLRVFAKPGETISTDAQTAKILLRSDPEGFALAGSVASPDPAAVGTGVQTVADLTAGGAIAKPEAESDDSTDGTDAAETASTTSAADASSDAHSDEDQGGSSTPADDPAATATGEAGTPPAAEPGPGATVLE